MPLWLVPPSTAPDSVSFAPKTIGRFGEMREALELVHLDEFRVFAAEAARRSLPLELVVGLALERQLILKDLASVGLGTDEIRRRLVGSARDVAPPQLDLGPGRLNSAYVRLLNRGTKDANTHDRGSQRSTIPARLCERLAEVDLATALDATA